MAARRTKLKIEMLDRALPPRIIIPWDVMDDIEEIVATRKDEVGWIGEAIELVDNDYKILKVTVPDQDANGTTTEITPDGIYECTDEDELNEINEDRFRYWGHSHGNMQFVNPSDQDEKQMKKFAKNCQWFIGTIHNRAGDIFGYAIDNRTGLYYESIDVVVEQHPDVIELENEIMRLEQQIEDTKINLCVERDAPDWKVIVKDRVRFKHYGNASGVTVYRGGRQVPIGTGNGNSNTSSSNKWLEKIAPQYKYFYRKPHIGDITEEEWQDFVDSAVSFNFQTKRVIVKYGKTNLNVGTAAWQNQKHLYAGAYLTWMASASEEEYWDHLANNLQ